MQTMDAEATGEESWPMDAEADEEPCTLAQPLLQLPEVPDASPEQGSPMHGQMLPETPARPSSAAPPHPQDSADGGAPTPVKMRRLRHKR